MLTTLIERITVWVVMLATYTAPILPDPTPALTVPDPFPMTTTEYTVTLTAYTCEAHPHNPMNAPGMCVTTAYGADPQTVGIACPPAWRRRRFVIEGYEQYGVVVCDDTGKYDKWKGNIHLDLRVPTLAIAQQIGVQVVRVREVPP
jgi:3D (Asp-Asp-Asp) domain-containing protein